MIDFEKIELVEDPIQDALYTDGGEKTHLAINIHSLGLTIWSWSGSASIPATRKNCQLILDVCENKAHTVPFGARLETENTKECATAQPFSDYISICISSGVAPYQMSFSICLPKEEVADLMKHWLAEDLCDFCPKKVIEETIK